MSGCTGGRARGVALALALVGGLAPWPARAQLAVDVLEVYLHPAQKAGRVGVIQVSNGADHAVQVVVEQGDWERDLEGKNVFLPRGKARGSCGEGLKVYPLSFRLGPKQVTPLRVSYEGSDTVGCWGIVFVQANERVRTQRSGLVFQLRTGVKVYVEPPDAHKDAAIADLKVVSSAAGAVSAKAKLKSNPVAQVLFRNTGEAHLRVKGTLEIRRADGSLAGTQEIIEFPMVPGAERRIDLPLPALSPGHYTLLALLDYGGEEIAAAQTDYESR